MILVSDPAQCTALTASLNHTASLTLEGPGGVYRLYVSWPRGPAPLNGWPVTYMLDGETFAAVCKTLLEQAGNAPPGLPVARMLVAIGYAGASRRAHDYVLVHTKLNGQTAGGAPAFRHFLLNDVRTAIAARWPVDMTRQTLMGHSLGGLFVLTTMFEAPHTFQTWVASSPSVWWHAGYLLTAAEQFAKARARPAVGIRVLLSAAEYEQALTPVEHQLPEVERNALLQTRASRAMVDGNRALGIVLAGAAGLSVNFHFLVGQTHRSAWLWAAAHALREPL